jgi:putative peptide zinc metalloprotease protein
MPPDAGRPLVGDVAPVFALASVQGSTVELAAYRGHRNVVVWFSRGFTCPFCLGYMDGIREGYQNLVGVETEVIQVAPNMLASARSFFGNSPAPFPLVCDPDKRLYAVYGLGDRGALEATRTAVVSFSYAVSQGEGSTWVKGAYVDGLNRNFLRRLHHHAMTAIEQGVFVVDKQGIIRHVSVVGPIDPVPKADRLAELVREHCTVPSSPA